jgi:hypothetical protein
MPYADDQAAAIFLSIKRRQGLAKAKAFARKHSDDSGRRHKPRAYRPRRKA